jgi:TDG/mug DNA glycosylase family protein
MRLKDVLCERPRVLFVGINPGARSGAIGHHFAGKGNPFWRLLAASGLTPGVIAPEDDQRLAEHGLALTNVCPRTTRTAAELTPDELRRGARTLVRKIARLEPRVVALTGVTLMPLLLGAAAARAEPGAGPKTPRLAGAPVFVLPNPSGLNASFPGFASKLVWFEALREFAAAQGA